MVFFSPVVINLLAFKVNSVDNESFLNAGSFVSVDKFLTYKRNQAVGEQNGDVSPINIPANFVIDPDLVDSSSVKNSIV